MWRFSSLSFALILPLIYLLSGCKKTTVESSGEVKITPEEKANVWPITGARLLIYDVEKTDYAKGGQLQRCERSKSVTIDASKPNEAAVETVDDYKHVMTEYFSVKGDEVSWTGIQQSGMENKKTQIEPPLLLFKNSFQGGETTGKQGPLDITVIGWEDIILGKEKIHVCKIRISLVSESADTFSGFVRTLWMSSRHGPVKEEKVLYKKGEIIQKESAQLRSYE